MIIEFIKRTENKAKTGKYYRIGQTEFVSDYNWGQIQIDKGNAIRIDMDRKSFDEVVKDENIKNIKKRVKELKKDK